MKNVTIDLLNIQSHENTQFTLRPGINFILSDDNNVGKSAIFKIISTAMQMPNVTGQELNELIRSKCPYGRATFRFDDFICNFWLSREDTTKLPTAFFEYYTQATSGNRVRSRTAPKELFDALDIVVAEDGKIVNFNDADSVQLIVQDTPKNDEVLAKVLIDQRVEELKKNAGRLYQEVQQDLRIANIHYDESTRVLDNLSYNPTVQDFESEIGQLSSACQALDILLSPVENLQSYKSQGLSSGVLTPAAIEEFQHLKSLLNFCNVIEDFLTIEQPQLVESITPDLFEYFNACFRVLQSLSTIEFTAIDKQLSIKESAISNAKRAVTVLSHLQNAVSAMYFVKSANDNCLRLQKEIETIVGRMKSISTVINCPVRGEVLYSNEQCVPNRN